MKQSRIVAIFLPILIFYMLLLSCETGPGKGSRKIPSSELQQLFDSYWQQRMKLLPLESTAIGDTVYNHLMPVTISASYRDTLKQFYTDFLNRSKALNEDLSDEDRISKELFEYELNLQLESFKYPGHLMPVNQFWSFTLEFPQLGSGSGNQPFKTIRDYDNFLSRMQLFPAWIDTAIQNMRTGMREGIVLPAVLAQRMVPQLAKVLSTDLNRNIFMSPVQHFPEGIGSEEKTRLTNAYRFAIANSLVPAYNKLKVFLEKEYIPACRTTAGISGIPGGDAYYRFLIKTYTTTELSPDSIYTLGLQQVASLKAEMEEVKSRVAFSGSLQEFFEHINSDKKFYPFKTAGAVLDSFRTIQKTIDPRLKTLFESSPKTPFEIRQTEAYRAASASAEYNAGSEDGSRPGIFYVPILDPAKFNAVGMETLFLHEAIPGHHYQISLQQENNSLPKFRKFLGYSAYAEGWALYTETLGKELGLYGDPYQYLGHLSDAMHRAIRLVVDVALHTRNMSREEAIAYMMANERISEQEATAEIERYMAIPGQALSYKIGQLSILALRKKYEAQLGKKFSLPAFHTQVLNGGNMPLQVLEKKLELWASSL